jgi:hypothetical protein
MSSESQLKNGPFHHSRLPTQELFYITGLTSNHTQLITEARLGNFYTPDLIMADMMSNIFPSASCFHHLNRTNIGRYFDDLHRIVGQKTLLGMNTRFFIMSKDYHIQQTPYPGKTLLCTVSV